MIHVPIAHWILPSPNGDDPSNLHLARISAADSQLTFQATEAIGLEAILCTPIEALFLSNLTLPEELGDEANYPYLPPVIVLNGYRNVTHSL